MSKIRAKFINLDVNTLQANGDNVQVKIIPSNPVSAGTNGIGLQTNSVDSNYIADGSVTVPKIAATNTPSNGQVASYDSASGKVVWATPASSDSKDIKVSANDATPGFLEAKIIGTAGKITVAVNNDGSNENLQVDIGSDVFDKTINTAADVPYNTSDVKTALDDLTADKADDSAVVHNSGDEAIAGIKTFSDDAVFNGNVTINGTTTTVNSQTVSTGDNIIELNNDMTTGAPTEDGGVRLLRGSQTAASLKWSEANKKWQAGLEGSEQNISYEGHSHLKTDITDFSETDYVHTTGNETVGGVKNFSSIPVLPNSDPSTANQAVRKSYVDGKVEQKKIEIRTLTSTEITNKQIALASTPRVNTAVELTPQGGCEQIYGSDFSVSGSTLTWNALGLDGILEAGDTVIISYHF